MLNLQKIKTPEEALSVARNLNALGQKALREAQKAFQIMGVDIVRTKSDPSVFLTLGEDGRLYVFKETKNKSACPHIEPFEPEKQA